MISTTTNMDTNNEIVEGEIDFEVLDQSEKDYVLRNSPKKSDKGDSIIMDFDSELVDEFFKNEPEMEHYECLKSKFGLTSFRQKQWDIIRTVMYERKDVCAVMATGYGKSLCFQFPAVFTRHMTLVVSPLIALMEAQVLALTSKGISACLVGTAQPDPSILKRINDGEFNIVYCSPEYLQFNNGSTLLNYLKKRLTLIAIDESHAISQYGHDFRTAYRKLTIIRERIPNVPILAMTATATLNVRQDIIGMLKMNDPKVFLSSFDRPNLEFIIHKKSQSPWDDIGPWLQNVNGSVIVYVLERKLATEFAVLFSQRGVNCTSYHAGLSQENKTDILKRFLANEFKVIFATIAFGMGIDKSDVQILINYGASSSIEAYYQEVGRAGRNGLPSRCITYFDIEDFELREWFLERGDCDGKKLSQVELNNLRRLNAKMREFLYSTKCRRKIILDYFDEDTSSLAPRPNCCDNCSLGLTNWRLSDLYEGVDDNGFFDFTCNAKTLLSAIQFMKRNDVITEKSRIKHFLTGVTKQEPKLRRFRSVTYLFGYGKQLGPHYWISLIEQLTVEQFIEEDSNNKTISVSAKGQQWLHKCTTVRLKAIGQMYEFMTKKRSTPFDDTKNAKTLSEAHLTTLPELHNFVPNKVVLKKLLEEVRNAIAITKHISSNEMVASDAALEKMATNMPTNFDEILSSALDDFTMEKLHRFGPTFVNAIARYSTGSLEMQGALLTKPLKNENIVVPLNVMRLIKLDEQKAEICRTLNLSEEQFFVSVQRLIENGHEISKNYVKMLFDIETIDFNQFRSNISDETLHSGLLGDVMLKIVQGNYRHSTQVELPMKFIRLMVSYHKVRDHLNQSKIPYFDFDDQSLQNPMKLIVAEKMIPNEYQEENVPPYPIRRRVGFSCFPEDDIWDIMFPELRGRDCYDIDESYYCNGDFENDQESEYDSDRGSEEHDIDDESEEDDTDDDFDEQDTDNEPCNDSNDTKETNSKRHSDCSIKEETSPKRRRS